MPKVVVTNTKGLVQSTGEGLALFGAPAQTLVAAAAGANALILPASTAVLATSGDNAHQISLPAIASVELGHTIAIANVDDAQSFVVITPGAETINGAASRTLAAAAGNLFIKAGAAAWIAV